MKHDIDFYFQPGEAKIHRELFEFSAAEWTGKGGKLVSSGHRVFARAAGKCEKEKREIYEAMILRKRLLISDIATRA